MKQMHVEVDGQAWFVRSFGEGPPVLLLHGFTGSADSWTDIAQVLQLQFEVIMVDLLGHGRSSSPLDVTAYTMEKTTDALCHVIHTLGHDQCNVVGYSMGGRVALGLACRHPQVVQKLVLESSSPGLKTFGERVDRQKSDEALAQMILGEGIEAFTEYWAKIPLFHSQCLVPAERRAEQRRIRLCQSAEGLAGSLRGIGTGAQPSFWTQLSSLKMPVLLLTGELDAKFESIADDMAQLLPFAKRVSVARAGHAMHIEVPDEYLSIVQPFLTQNWR